MLIPSAAQTATIETPSLSRRVNANSQRNCCEASLPVKLIKKGEC